MFQTREDSAVVSSYMPLQKSQKYSFKLAWNSEFRLQKCLPVPSTSQSWIDHEGPKNTQTEGQHHHTSGRHQKHSSLARALVRKQAVIVGLGPCGLWGAKVVHVRGDSSRLATRPQTLKRCSPTCKDRQNNKMFANLLPIAAAFPKDVFT